MAHRRRPERGACAAAYRVLADLEGVDFLGRVPDREGRARVAAAGTLMGWTLLLGATYTDETPPTR